MIKWLKSRVGSFLGRTKIVHSVEEEFIQTSLNGILTVEKNGSVIYRGPEDRVPPQIQAEIDFQRARLQKSLEILNAKMDGFFKNKQDICNTCGKLFTSKGKMTCDNCLKPWQRV